MATILLTTDFYSSLVLDLVCEWTARKSIAGASEFKFNDGIYAEVPLWSASGLIARRWIVPTCVWKLSDCKKGSECWKIATRGPVGRNLYELLFRDRAGQTCTCVQRVAGCV
jgi:hypothetical protein